MYNNKRRNRIRCIRYKGRRCILNMSFDCLHFKMKLVHISTRLGNWIIPTVRRRACRWCFLPLVFTASMCRFLHFYGPLTYSVLLYDRRSSCKTVWLTLNSRQSFFPSFVYMRKNENNNNNNVALGEEITVASNGGQRWMNCN